MKILGTILRFLCALIVLLAVAVYLDGSLQATLLEYIKSFTPAHLAPLASLESWFAIAVGALLLLTLCGGIRLGWNMVYSLVTLVFFAEAAIMAFGPELALPTATRGLGWEPLLRELALNYPVPGVMIPLLCVLGCLCSNAPVRIALTSLICTALCYGCAELLSLGVQHWQAMSEPFLPRALDLIGSYPWLLAALPAVFFLQFCLFMAIFETFAKEKNEEEEKAGKKAEDKKETAPAVEKKEETPAAAPKVEEKASSATVEVPATRVVVKRPVIHKKSPISPAPATGKNEAKPEDKKEDAPAEEKKPEGEQPAAPAQEEAPMAEEAPKAEEPVEAPAEEDAPAAKPIPSVPLPPAPGAAS